MDRRNYLKGVVRNDPSKLRYFTKDYNTYKITFSEDDKKVKEYYEVKYLLYRIPLAKIGYFGDKSPISLACLVLLFSWIFLILFILGIGLSIGLDSTCNNSNCSNVTCTIRNQTALDYGLIDEWTLDNTLNDSVRCNDLTAFPGASFNKISNSPRIFAGYLQPNGYYAAPPDVYFSGGDFTITSYVYVMSVQNWARIIDFGIVQADSIFLSTSAFTTGQPIARIFNSNTLGGLLTQSPTALTLNRWTHVAAILRGTTLSLYIDTNLIRSETVSVLPRNVVRLNNFIGRSNWVADSYANAKYRNIRIYNRALSASELLVDFNDQ